MQNKAKQQARVTKSTLGSIEYERQVHRIKSNDDADDKYRNGELLVAANILTELAAKQERQRNLVEQATIFDEMRAGTYDYRHDNAWHAGYADFPKEPPPNWPLPAAAFPNPHTTQPELLQKAAALIVAEFERYARLQNNLNRMGSKALDPDYVELQQKRAEIAQRRSTHNWKLRSKQRANEKAVDSAEPQAYAGTLTPAVSNTIDFSKIQECVPQTCEPDYFDDEGCGSLPAEECRASCNADFCAAN